MMILGQKFDKTLIGKNYLSFIVGLTFLRKKQSVLLIDDKRIGFDTLWGHYLTYLDFQYLQLWGIIYDINELKRLNQYLHKVPIKFYTGENSLYLAHEPFDNLNECLRRFPDIFGPVKNAFQQQREEFNQTYYSCTEHLAEISFRFQGLHTINSNFYQEMKWPYFDQLLGQVYEQYRQLLKDRPEHPFIQFIFLAKSLYHREILFELSYFEMGHLLLCLLGPIYQIDYQALETDLSHRFQELGGHYKQSTINSWQIDKNKLAHIELNSFEGVIIPHQCYFMGQLSADFPFTNGLHPGGHRAALYKIRSNQLFDLVKGERILYSQFDHLGGDIPLIDFYGESSELLHAWVAYRNRLGSKHSFYQKHTQSFLHQALQNILIRQVKDRDLEYAVEESQTFWVCRPGMEFEKNRSLRTGKLKLMESLAPLAQRPINHFDYWGPLRCYSVGLFSYLLELKDSFH